MNSALPNLLGKRGCLRPADMGDLPMLQAAASNFPERLPLRIMAEQGKLANWLQQACHLSLPGRLWSFDLYDGTRCIAQVGLTPRSQQRDLALSFWLQTDYQGQGLAREAVSCALRDAFTDPGLPQIWAGSAVWNKAAHDLLMALGFIVEKENPPGYLVRGEMENILGFILPRPAWAGASSAELTNQAQ